jgi:CHAD domain-containing protein
MGKPPAIAWDKKSSVAGNARRVLPRLVAAYSSQVRELLAEDPPPAKLHAIRLASKRLRYTLELFRPCYGPGLEARLAALRRLQQLLGEVNDSVVARKLIQKSMRMSPLRARAERFLEERAAAQSAEFRRNWTEVFDAPGHEQRWARYLARNARST